MARRSSIFRVQQIQLLLVLGVVAAVHLIISLGVFPQLRSNPAYPLEDKDHYIGIARNLAGGSGFILTAGGPPTMQRMPAYPLLLAGIILLGGDAQWITMAVQLAMLLVSCFWVGRLAGRDSNLAGCAAALFLGFCPLSVIYVPRYFSEILLLFFMSGGLYFLGRFLAPALRVSPALNGQPPTPQPSGPGPSWNFLVAAVFFTGAWLTRSVVAIWLVSAIGLMLREKAFRGRGRWTWFAGVGFVLVGLAPWVVRNYLVSGAFIPLNTWDTRSALHGLRTMTHPEAERHSRALDNYFQRQVTTELSQRLGYTTGAQREVLADAVAGQWLVHEWMARPGITLLTWLRGLYRAYFLTSTRPVQMAAGAFNFVLAGLILFGHALPARPNRLGSLSKYLWLLLLLIYLLQSVLYPHVRYLFPLLPAQTVLAGIGLARLFSWKTSITKRWVNCNFEENQALRLN